MNKVFSSLISSLKSSLFTKRLSIPRISGLVVGVLSVLFAGVLPFSLFLSGVLTFEGARYFGSFMFYGGLAACLYVGLTTKFRADWRIRKQVVSLAAFMVVLMSVFAVVEAPAVNALTPLPSDTGPGNSSAYKFSVPFMEYRWLVAEFRDHTYYALNGSDWNIMTIVEPWQPVAPWAALAENKTALVEQVLSVTDPGKVLLNELSFDYGLVVPENVTVVESLNGLTRQFINSANTQGSPYTVSVDTVNPTYYLAQDSADRFIDEWSSTNWTTIMQTTVDSASTSIINLSAMNATVTAAVTLKSGVQIIGTPGVSFRFEDIVPSGHTKYTGGTLLYASGIDYIFTGVNCSKTKIENLGVFYAGLVHFGSEASAGGVQNAVENVNGYSLPIGTYFINIENSLHCSATNVWVAAGQLIRIAQSGYFTPIWNFGNHVFVNVGCSSTANAPYAILIENTQTATNTTTNLNLISFYHVQVNAAVTSDPNAAIMIRSNSTVNAVDRISLYDADFENYVNPVKIAGYVHDVYITNSQYPDYPTKAVMLIKSAANKTPWNIFLTGYNFRTTQDHDYDVYSIALYAENETTVLSGLRIGSQYQSNALNYAGINYVSCDNKASNPYNITGVTGYGSSGNPYTRSAQFLYVPSGMSLAAGNNTYNIYTLYTLNIAGGLVTVTPVSGFSQGNFTVEAKCTAFNLATGVSTIQVTVVSQAPITLASNLVFLVMAYPVC